MEQLWLTLAEQYLNAMAVDWDQVELNCFSERITPEDEQIGAQILRVIHFSLFFFNLFKLSPTLPSHKRRKTLIAEN